MSTMDKILLLLEQNNLTQKDLTDYLKIDKSIFSQWKAGKSKSYSKYIDKIAEFLDTTPSYLWGWDEANEKYNKKKQKK